LTLARTVLGLLAALSILPSVTWAQGVQEVVTDVWVHDVPGPPTGDFWHPAILNGLNVYPNVMVCLRPMVGGSRSCAAVCRNVQGDTKLGGRLRSKECRRSLRQVLRSGDPRMQVEVFDMNDVFGQPRFHVVIARVGVTDPSACPHVRPCEMRMQKGSLVLSFGQARPHQLHANSRP
jgi:hypothetical protein